MCQIICQSGTQKCLYLRQNDLSKLRYNIKIDFDEAPNNFQLMYIDHQFGDWMIIENQADLDKIYRLNKREILLKVLPPVQEDRGECNMAKVKKLLITQDMKKMVQFVSNKHIERYLHKKMTQKMMQLSEIMLEQKVPPSKTRFQTIDRQIQLNLSRERPRKRIERLSPSKISINLKIEKAVICKVSQFMNKNIGNIYQECLNNIKCSKCRNSKDSIQEMIILKLLRKINKRKQNPQQ